MIRNDRGELVYAVDVSGDVRAGWHVKYDSGHKRAPENLTANEACEGEARTKTW